MRNSKECVPVYSTSYCSSVSRSIDRLLRERPQCFIGTHKDIFARDHDRSIGGFIQYVFGKLLQFVSIGLKDCRGAGLREQKHPTVTGSRDARPSASTLDAVLPSFVAGLHVQAMQNATHVGCQFDTPWQGSRPTSCRIACRLSIALRLSLSYLLSYLTTRVSERLRPCGVGPYGRGRACRDRAVRTTRARGRRQS